MSLTRNALSLFSTCEISDALIKLGIPHGGHIPDINRICLEAPKNKSICGPAFTVQMVLTSDKSAPKLENHFVDQAEAGAVMVIDAPPHAKNAVWGGLMTAGAQARGVFGVIISGRCRDLAEHDAAGFAVFARGHSTLGQSPFTRPSAVNVPLTIRPQPFDSELLPVTIEPGDMMVADADGVVCVPELLVEDVVEMAKKGREVDERCKRDIEAGFGVQATFKKHRGK
ncbi:RraA-like protein [Rickenella mellea]|uniref:RraA-like protein n=1 Tax=Rickenella mellea TaxID=50990 RepID=A0A4Y7QGL4_9AGAM|nr:RraA-like protein [Rickenella mellea]